MTRLNKSQKHLRKARDKRKLRIESLKRRHQAEPDDDPEFVPGYFFSKFLVLYLHVRSIKVYAKFNFR